MSLEGKSEDEIKALAALAEDVLSKPDTAGVFKRLVKKNNPNVSMPDIELEERARAEFGKVNKELGDIKAEREHEKAEKQVGLLYEALRDESVVSSRADFNGLVKWASENGFMTTETGLRKASMQRRMENETAEPTPQHVNNGTFGVDVGNADLSKSFMADPTGTARTVAAQAMDELRKKRAAGTKTH